MLSPAVQEHVAEIERRMELIAAGGSPREASHALEHIGAAALQWIELLSESERLDRLIQEGTG